MFSHVYGPFVSSFVKFLLIFIAVFAVGALSFYF